MPMYMDIHEIKGATAEEVAKAHRADVETQQKYGVEYHKYWLNLTQRFRASYQGARDPARRRLAAPASRLPQSPDFGCAPADQTASRVAVGPGSTGVALEAPVSGATRSTVFQRRATSKRSFLHSCSTRLSAC